MNRRSYDLVKAKKGDSGCQWSAQSYNLAHIADRFAMPMVIKLDVRSGCLTREDNRLQLTEQPMLLYSTRTKEKLVAKHLRYDGKTEPVAKKVQASTTPVDGEKMIIPEDYSGWFVHLKSTREVKCYDTIEQVFAAKVKSFVTGSTLVGLQAIVGADGTVQYKHRQFLSGSVFKTEKLCVGKVRVDAGMKFLLWRRTKLQDVKYLKCFDVQNREILLATNKSGKFFEITPVFFSQFNKEKTIFNTDDLFSLRQIISPIMLIYGEGPRVLNFTGIMQVQRRFTDKTIVAATTLERNNHVVLEISVLSSTKYHLALNSKHLFRHGSLGAAFKHCKRRSDLYVQRIRVPFTLSPEEKSDLDRNDATNGYEQTRTDRKLEPISESLIEEELGDEINDFVVEMEKEEDRSNLEEIKNEKTNNNEGEKEQFSVEQGEEQDKLELKTPQTNDNERENDDEENGEEVEESRTSEEHEEVDDDEIEDEEAEREMRVEEAEREMRVDEAEREMRVEEAERERRVEEAEREMRLEEGVQVKDVQEQSNITCDLSDSSQAISRKDDGLVDNVDRILGQTDRLTLDDQNGNSLKLNAESNSEHFAESVRPLSITDVKLSDIDTGEHVVRSAEVSELESDVDKMSESNSTDGSDSGISDQA